MVLVRSIFTSLLVQCCLLGLVLSSASAQTDKLLAAPELSKVMNSLVKKKNSIRFTIDGHQVVGLLNDKSQQIQLIYIFPRKPGAADCKAQLAKAVQNVQKFFLHDQAASHTYIHSDDLFAQIRVDANPTIESPLIESCTSNFVLFMLKTVGPPQGWKDNRLIWIISFNSNRTRLELALDIWQDNVDSLDFSLVGNSASSKVTIETFNRLFDLNLRAKKDNEAKAWSSYTGFPASQILGADSLNSFSDAINGESLFLIEKKNKIRLAKKDTLRASNRDQTTWVQSSKVAFPSTVEDLAAITLALAMQDTPTANPDSDSSIAAPAPKENETVKYATPGIALESYIKQLYAK